MPIAVIAAANLDSHVFIVILLSIPSYSSIYYTSCTLPLDLTVPPEISASSPHLDPKNIQLKSASYTVRTSTDMFTRALLRALRPATLPCRTPAAINLRPSIPQTATLPFRYQPPSSSFTTSAIHYAHPVPTSEADSISRQILLEALPMLPKDSPHRTMIFFNGQKWKVVEKEHEDGSKYEDIELATAADEHPSFKFAPLTQAPFQLPKNKHKISFIYHKILPPLPALKTWSNDPALLEPFFDNNLHEKYHMLFGDRDIIPILASTQTGAKKHQLYIIRSGADFFLYCATCCPLMRMAGLDDMEEVLNYMNGRRDKQVTFQVLHTKDD